MVEEVPARVVRNEDIEALFEKTRKAQEVGIPLVDPASAEDLQSWLEKPKKATHEITEEDTMIYLAGKDIVELKATTDQLKSATLPVDKKIKLTFEEILARRKANKLKNGIVSGSAAKTPSLLNRRIGKK